MVISTEISLKELIKEMNIIQESNHNGVYKIITKINTEHAIIIFTPPTFTEKSILSLINDAESEIQTVQNDIYSCFEIKSLANFGVRVIYPASEFELKKHSKSQFAFEEETSDMYEKKLEKVKEVENLNSNWIRNIVNSSSEFEDFNFSKNGSCGDKENNKDKSTESLESCIALIKNKENTEDKENEDKNEICKKRKITNDEFNTAINLEFIKTLEKEIKLVKKDGTIQLMKEKIFYNDSNFVILPNYQWDCKSIDKLYLILLFKQEGLFTIRDLNNVNLLKLAKEKILETCLHYFGLKDENLYMFFHYHPSYYSLHLHICSANFFCASADVAKAILFEDVLTNLSNDINFYKNKNMRIKVKASLKD